MRRQKLTKRVIDRLPPTDKKGGKRYYDAELPGFGVAVYPSGARTFFVEYGPKSRRRRMSLGRYGILTPDEARARAIDALGQVVRGSDPLDERAAIRSVPVFRVWVDEWLGKFARERKPRTVVEYRRHLALAVDRWGSRRLDQITPTDVRVGMQVAAERGSIDANRWLAAVRSCFSTAVEEGVVLENPAMKVKLNRENPPRSRVLNSEELERVLDAIALESDPHTQLAFHLLIETGARHREVLEAKWSDFDLDAGTWRIPSPKAGFPQVIPIAAQTVERLRSTPRVGDYVVAGRDPTKPRYDLRRPWKRILERTGLEDVWIHDLRRTFGLHIAKSAGLHVASKLLRHGDVRTTERVYAPLGLDDLRDALNNAGGRGSR